MNIFKILASGDGSINEPNVSAFLGYLLNPKADHGVGDELLKKILFNLYENNKNSSLKEFLVKKDKVRNLSTNSNFNIEIFLEQAFKKERETRTIVDIVVLCYEKKSQPKESLAKVFLSNDNRRKEDLKQIFLIENKIKDQATKSGQLKEQYLSTVNCLSDIFDESEVEIKHKVSIIFISPDAEKSNSEFEGLCEDSTIDIPKTQIHWAKPKVDESIDGNTM